MNKIQELYSLFLQSKFYKPLKILLILGIFIVMPITLIILKKYHLENFSTYTVGTTTRKTFVPSQAWWDIEYKFYYKNKWYVRIQKYREGIKVPNGRYYVEFSNERPFFAKLLYSYPVPDSIKFVPNDGWDSIPGIGKPNW